MKRELWFAMGFGAALFLVAATHVGVDTTSTQTLQNKTMAGLTYTTSLRINDIQSQSSSFSVTGHREHRVTTGASTLTATLPAATGTGDVYDICKADTGAGTVVITRAGSDVIRYASGGSGNTRTLGSRGDCDTIQDWASGEWIARGNGL